VTRKAKKSSDWTHQRIWKDTSQTAYVAGLYLDNDRVLVSYGSSDIDARLLSMSVSETEAMFDGPFDCSQSEVLDNGSGQPMPLLGSSSATAEVAGTAVRQQKQVQQSHAAEVNAKLLRDVVKTAGSRPGSVPNGSAGAAAAVLSGTAAGVLHTEAGSLPAGAVAKAQYHHQHKRQHLREHRNAM
jgi:hypothetical protein